MSMNTLCNCTLMGFVGMDPEMVTTNGGQNIVKLRIAVNYSNGMMNPDGSRAEQTKWVSVSCFQSSNPRVCDFVQKYVKKGSSVVVYGSMNIPTIFTRKDGTNDVDVEIVANDINFLPSSHKKDDANGTVAPQQQAYAQRAPQQPMQQPQPTYQAQPQQVQQRPMQQPMQQPQQAQPQQPVQTQQRPMQAPQQPAQQVNQQPQAQPQQQFHAAPNYQQNAQTQYQAPQQNGMATPPSSSDDLPF